MHGELKAVSRKKYSLGGINLYLDLEFSQTSVAFLRQLEWLQAHEGLPRIPLVVIKSITENTVNTIYTVDYSLEWNSYHMDLRAVVDASTGHVLITEVNSGIILSEGIGLQPDNVGSHGMGA